ncbi:zinc-binding dehydrogenase [Bradyrhizobium sp. WYCCWR 13023]|uniref:Zinc-binding dehydrogenase n=1 Tax=Bradyrhizobium zhengyangense TaxID=2911009 RepID=A0A9X1UA32_9BRAD|nr:zinc-binding dehydrogenase [Bradyrhizobium zhengyangense]MCG2642824.1 zinc-binding dehydrogenase [Bradyrhizobium zhengyangense]MCG2669568.1 zinc-binding dehydrogenase [Bradyrhizobium zhengyangense]
MLVDGPDLPKRVASETGGAPIHLALDMVGGPSTMNLMNCVAPKGVVVIYSAMSGQPFSGSSQRAIFAEVSVRGFWLVHWLKTATAETMGKMYDHLTPLVTSGALTAPVAATYGLEQFADAIAQAASFKGKVIFTPNRA